MNVDAAKGDALIVYNDEVINVVRFVKLEDVDGEHIGGEGDGAGCHDSIDGFFKKVWGLYKVPAQISIGENAE